MNKKGLINKTIEALEKLPEDKVNEVATFADFVLKRYEEQTPDSFAFLHEEEDLYDESDLKEKY
jgi:hypothetical protein